MAKILLSEIVDDMEMQNDMCSNYYHIPTGKIVLITEDDMSYAENDEPVDSAPDWQEESIKIAKEILMTDDYLSLPSQRDIHEWEIMHQFSLSIPGEIGEILNDSIHGSGAFRMFKDKIFNLGIQEDWYHFKKNNFFDIAKNWCKGNNIEFIDDREIDNETTPLM